MSRSSTARKVRRQASGVPRVKKLAAPKSSAKPTGAAVVDIRRFYSDKPGVEEIHKRNRNAITSAIYGLQTTRKQRKQEAVQGPGTNSDRSKEMANDPFVRLEATGKIVPPPFDPLTLAVMPENNTELGPAIEAMVVNVGSFGWRLEPRLPVSERTSIEMLKELANERIIAENFFRNAFDDENSLEEFRDKIRRDLEGVGGFFVEFLEVPGTGELDGLNHIPAWMCRLGKQDSEPTEFTSIAVMKKVQFTEESANDTGSDGEDGEDAEGRVRVRKQKLVEDFDFELVPQRRFKRFRRFVQVRGGRTVWFKERGDPRLIDARDGSVVPKDKLLERDQGEVDMRFTLDGEAVVVRRGEVGFPIKWAANSMKYVHFYSARSPYGLPRYIGHLFSIYGSRAAEEINYISFKNNNIPSAVIMVQNGQLTQESTERLQEFTEAVMSDDNYTKYLVLEGEPIMEGARDPGNYKIEIQPLTKDQHTDALFVNYQDHNDERVRRAFRFPPIFVGKSDDFTGRTIDASRRLGDEQVFQPERAREDNFFTKQVLLDLGVFRSTFRSNSAFVAENGDIIRMMAAGEKTGGLTPRIARKVFGRVLNEDLGDIDPDKFDPDVPFALTLVDRMMSNSSTEANGGGEASSQGRIGAPVGGAGRDRENEPAAEDLDKGAFEALRSMLRKEMDRRFGGLISTAFHDDIDLEDAVA